MDRNLNVSATFSFFQSQAMSSQPFLQEGLVFVDGL